MKQYKTFAIIGLGWLGDTILTAGLCSDIKNIYPDARIFYVCTKQFSLVPALISDVDEIIPYEKRSNLGELRNYLEFAELFKNIDIDVAIITHPHERSILCAKLTKAKNIISLSLKGINPLNFFINKKRKLMETEIRNTYKGYFNSDYLKLLGKDPLYSQIKLTIPSDAKINLEKYNLPKQYIVLAPDSKDLIKNWDYKNVLSFIKKCPMPVILTGTEKTDYLANQLINDKANFINLCGKTSILELARIIENSHATVSVDTGTMHLAYGLGCRTVCIFYNEQMVKEWLPQNNNNISLLLGKRYRENGEILYKKEISADEVLLGLFEKNEKGKQ